MSSPAEGLTRQATTAEEIAGQILRLQRLPRGHWTRDDFRHAAKLLQSIRLNSSLPAALQLPCSAWRLVETESVSDGLVFVFVQRLAAQYRSSRRPADGLRTNLQSTLRAARAVAGQKLLHSPFHSSYLKLRKFVPAHADPSLRAYEEWILREQALTPPPDVLREQASRLSLQPKISLLLAVHNPRIEWLQETVTSVLSQAYTNWELCIYDDASRDLKINDYLRGLDHADPRIRVALSSKHVGISEALNEAANLASGEFIASIDHDDLLPYWSLYSVAEGLQESDVDVLYTDEDFIDEASRRRAPHFKPAWSPTLLQGCMYFGHMVVVRRALFEEIGRYRSRYDGAQDYDLALRATERARSIVHIPKVAYHWRMHSDSVAGDRRNKAYTHSVGLEALRSAAERRDWRDSTVSDGDTPNLFFLDRAGPKQDDVDIVTTESVDDINRAGAKGMRPFIIFVQSRLEPAGTDWSQRLLQHMARGDAGIVGARLIARNALTHHAGVTLGANGDLGRPGRASLGSPFWLWLNAAREVTAIDFNCFAVRRDLFEALQGFDESMAPSYRAADFCLRAAERGYSTLIEPRAALSIRSSTSAELPPGEEWAAFVARWAHRIAEPDRYFSQNLALDGGDISL